VTAAGYPHHFRRLDRAVTTARRLLTAHQHQDQTTQLPTPRLWYFLLAEQCTEIIRAATGHHYFGQVTKQLAADSTASEFCRRYDTIHRRLTSQ
jgi:hypothetical protein